MFQGTSTTFPGNSLEIRFFWAAFFNNPLYEPQLWNAGLVDDPFPRYWASIIISLTSLESEKVCPCFQNWVLRDCNIRQSYYQGQLLEWPMLESNTQYAKLPIWSESRRALTLNPNSRVPSSNHSYLFNNFEVIEDTLLFRSPRVDTRSLKLSEKCPVSTNS
jgi:hypothetical protein